MALFGKRKERSEKVFLKGREGAELKYLRKESKLSKQRKELEKYKEQYKEQSRYLKRPSVRFARGIESGLSSFAAQRRRQLIAARDVRRPLIGSGYKKQSGGRGRPKGSYDPRYAAYGGVYGFRRALNQQLRLQRLQAIRNAQLSPNQQMLLARQAQMDRARMINPENQVIPDTSGSTPMEQYQKEIDDAANAVP